MGRAGGKENCKRKGKESNRLTFRMFPSRFQHFACLLSTNGQLWYVGSATKLRDGENSGYFVECEGMDEITSVGLGYSIMGCIDNQNVLWIRGSIHAPKQKEIKHPTCPSFRSFPILQEIKQLSSGMSHLVAVTLSGDLIGLGENERGELGLHRARPDEYYVQGVNASCVYVSCGRHSTVVLDNEGCLWTFGSNSSGQLGRGSGPEIKAPEKLSLDCSFVSVGAGQADFVVALSSTGEVYSWGDNSEGYLGRGMTARHRRRPKLVPLPPITSIYVGGYHTYVLTTSGEVWGFGHSHYGGQLGLGENGGCMHDPVKIPSIIYPKMIALGCSSTFYLDQDDQLWACGWNGSKNIGIGSSVHQPQF